MSKYLGRFKNIIGVAVALVVVAGAAFCGLMSKKTDSSVLPALSLAKTNLQFEIFEDVNYDTTKNLAGYNYTKEVVIRVPVATKATAYEWNVTSTAQGRIFSQTYTTHLPELSDAELQVPSIYSVKVRYKNESEQWSDWSEAAAMRVVLASPRLSVEQSSSTATLKWTQIKKSSLYEVVISQDAKFAVTDTKQTESNIYVYENLTDGIYFARVRTLNSNGWPTSAWSKTTAFDVVMANRIATSSNLSRRAKNRSDQLAMKLFDQRHVASVSEEDEASRISPTTMRAPIEEIKTPKVRNVSLYSGIGTNYLKFDQSNSSGLESGKFSSVTSPTLMVEAGMQWDENWHYGASFHQMPGSIMNNPSTTINQTDYKWSYLGLEAERKISDNIFGAKLSIMGGVQRHEMPFLIGGTTTDVELIQTQLTTGALGFHAEWSPEERWLFEAFMRYQVPLMSSGGNGGVFHVTGGMSYDGLVGVSRKIFDNWKVGIYWFGQSHDLNYTYKSDDGLNDRDGKQILFNSDLQVRFGYAWYFGQMIFVFGRRRKEDEPNS